MKKQRRVTRIALCCLIAGFVLTSHGCKNDDNPVRSSEDLLIVKRDPAYTGCYPILSTSQSTCWDSAGIQITAPLPGESLYGQDAQYPHMKPLYTKSIDGLTVKDEVTGLTWQKSYEKGDFGGMYYWAESQALINTLNAQKYGGYGDWRLPTIKELYSLWDAGTGWPWIDTNYFDIKYSDQEDLSHAIFWSSDKYTGVLGATGNAPGAELAFGVNFGTGHIKAYSISVGPRHFVRCVRGNLAYGGNVFQNNGDGTISDLATGLMWLQADNGSGMDWVHALSYVQKQNGANYLGHNDWRLPNAKELQSIVDYTRSPGATNASNVGPAINSLFSCTGITNGGGHADYPYYWTNTSAKQDANGTYRFAWYVAFGRAEDGQGEDLHGAGAVRFDAKVAVGNAAGEERVNNFVRLVRTIK